MKKITITKMTRELLGAAVLIIVLFLFIALMCNETIGGTGIVMMILSIIGYGVISGVQVMDNASPKLQNIMAYAKIGFVILLLALSPLINKIAAGI